MMYKGSEFSDILNVWENVGQTFTAKKPPRTYTPNGNRECAKRIRQILRASYISPRNGSASLRADNGVSNI